MLFIVFNGEWIEKKSLYVCLSVIGFIVMVCMILNVVIILEIGVIIRGSEVVLVICMMLIVILVFLVWISCFFLVIKNSKFISMW